MPLAHHCQHSNAQLIKETFLSWPGIENINFKKIITNLTPTAKGHRDQERVNLKITKASEEMDDFEPTDIIANKTWENAATIYQYLKKHIQTKMDHYHIAHHGVMSVSWSCMTMMLMTY